MKRETKVLFISAPHPWSDQYCTVQARMVKADSRGDPIFSIDPRSNHGTGYVGSPVSRKKEISMSWKPIEIAPRTGCLVWLACIDLRVSHMDLLKLDADIRNMNVKIHLARYDTWHHVWRTAEAGEHLIPPKCRPPELWFPCDIPTRPTYNEALPDDLRSFMLRDLPDGPKVIVES